MEIWWVSCRDVHCSMRHGWRCVGVFFIAFIRCRCVYLIIKANPVSCAMISRAQSTQFPLSWTQFRALRLAFTCSTNSTFSWPSLKRCERAVGPAFIIADLVLSAPIGRSSTDRLAKWMDESWTITEMNIHEAWLRLIGWWTLYL